eukprot:COSAG02_NODE_8047_length_2733_cov_4.237288_4_plen_90_part_00
MAESFKIEPATVDQAAAALALLLGAVGSLLLVIWQSRCLCRCRIGISDQCFCFDCTREPPPVDPEKASLEPTAPSDTTEPEPEPEPEQA